MMLITGGAGFIGSNFVKLMHEKNPETDLLILDKLTYAGNYENIKNIANYGNNKFYEMDICDTSLLNKIFLEHSPEVVVNFAAESHVDRSISSPGSFIDTNILGTFNLLETSKNFYDTLAIEIKENFKFLHISTDEVFGSLGPDDAKFTESNQYKPNSPYAASKASSDHLCRAYWKTYQLPIMISNCSNNYGPHQYPEKLIPLCIKNALQEKKIPIYGDGLQIRDWLFVQDHCVAIKTIIASGKAGETYNVGGNNEIQNIDLVHSICQSLDIKSPRKNKKQYQDLITFVEDRKGHDQRYAIDSLKIKADLSWEPTLLFDDGLDKTIDWYLDNYDWGRDS
jgi:dTDP-glucose 4,6-dehydratase